MFESNCNGNRRDKVVLRTTCIKNVKFKLIKTRSGCRYAACCRILLLQRKHKLGCTKPSTGPDHGLRLRVGHRWFRNRLMCLSCYCRGGQPVRDQEPHFLLCYSKVPHHVHCPWAHMNITPSLPHSHTYFCLARFIVNITYHQYENNRTLQGIYC